MKEQNANLSKELGHWADQATRELELKRKAEKEVNRLNNLNQGFQQEVNELTITNFSYFQGFSRIIPLLEELKAEMPLDFAL